MRGHQSVIVPCVLVLVAIVFLIVGGSQVWYQLNWNNNFKIDLYLDRQTYTGPLISDSYTVNWADTDSFSNLKEVYAYCGSFSLVGLIFFFIVEVLLVLQLLCRICAGKGHICINKLERLLLIIASMVGEICAIIGCLMLLRQPSAMEDDFDDYHLGTSCNDGELVVPNLWSCHIVMCWWILFAFHPTTQRAKASKAPMEDILGVLKLGGGLISSDVSSVFSPQLPYSNEKERSLATYIFEYHKQRDSVLSSNRVHSCPSFSHYSYNKSINSLLLVINLGSMLCCKYTFLLHIDTCIWIGFRWSKKFCRRVSTQTHTLSYTYSHIHSYSRTQAQKNRIIRWRTHENMNTIKNHFRRDNK